MKKLIFILGILLSLPSLAYANSHDVALLPEDVKIPEVALEGKKLRFYATTTSFSDRDVKGIIRFFTGGEQLGADQPVSVVARKEDTVFIDADLSQGTHEILIKFFPFDVEDDDLNNNSVRKTLRVVGDADRDGKPDETDPDDDNDGVLDEEDTFPLDRKEQKDTDSDGAGDNKDSDDDNDGIPDETDCAPLDATLSKDADSDRVCDKNDAFPKDPTESKDMDRDGRGDNKDPDADNDGIAKTKDTNDLNLGPEIKLSGLPFFPALKEKIVIDLSTIKDPEGEVKSIEVTLKEPEKEEMKNLKVTEDKKIVFSLDRPGEYELNLRAVDDKGESRERTIPLKVRNTFFYMGGLFITLLLVTLVIFGLIAYSSSHKRKKPWYKKLLKKIL